MPGLLAALELKLPPPVVAALSGVAMWAFAPAARPLLEPDPLRLATGLLPAAAGIGVIAAGILAFRRARTTIDPLHPERASALVAAGIYRHTRNPMYLGMLLVLLGWAAYLADPFTLLGPLAFALYLTRFQILPEERALSARFGAGFEAYRAQVRRWL